MTTLRDMTEASEFTCDWGYCDDESAAERLDLQSGKWLAVCIRHKGVEARKSPGRADCHHCAGPGSGQKPESKETT